MILLVVEGRVDRLNYAKSVDCGGGVRLLLDDGCADDLHLQSGATTGVQPPLYGPL